jgi:hypothetical protein
MTRLMSRSDQDVVFESIFAVPFSGSHTKPTSMGWSDCENALRIPSYPRPFSFSLHLDSQPTRHIKGDIRKATYLSYLANLSPPGISEANEGHPAA